jgi:solute carrier family 45 protein 3
LLAVKQWSAIIIIIVIIIESFTRFSRGTPQHSRCFTVYSFMVSIGGCVGYLITAVDWANNPVGEYLGGQEHSVFMVLVVLFSFAFLMTFGAATEVPLTDDVIRRIDDVSGVVPQLKVDGDNFGTAFARKSDNEPNGYVNKGVGVGQHLQLAYNHVASPRRLITGPLTSCLISIIASIRSSTPFRNLSNVPFVLRRLALANFCSWTAVMGFNLFFSDFVGQAVFGGDPSAPEDSELRQLYDRGVRVGSFGLLLHCVSSAAYASVVERIMARTDLRTTYFAGMATFVFCMALMAMTQNVYIVSIMAAMTGVGYATLTTAPFMLLTIYHEDEQV